MNNGNEDTKLKLKVLDDLQSKDNQIESLKKEIDLVREEAQVTQLQLEKKLQQKDDRIRELEQISKEHQKINSELRTDVNNMTEMCEKYKDEIKSIELGTVNNFRRKGVL